MFEDSDSVSLRSFTASFLGLAEPRNVCGNASELCSPGCDRSGIAIHLLNLFLLRELPVSLTHQPDPELLVRQNFGALSFLWCQALI